MAMNHDMAEQLARRIRNVLGEFNDDDKGVETLVRELAEYRRAHITQPAQAVDVPAVADALENEYLAVANGEKKPGRIALEPLVRAVQTIRALAGEQVGWRDIATAPKDGTYILLSQRWLRDEPFIGSWGRGKWEPDTRCYETNGDAIVVSNISDQDDIDLWAPLPTSPTDKDQR